MSTGAVPQDWKEATLSPIFKGGIPSDSSNYRQIFLTSIFSNIMERVVVLDLLLYCRTHKLISKQQYGFLSKRFTVIQHAQLLK